MFKEEKSMLEEDFIRLIECICYDNNLSTDAIKKLPHIMWEYYNSGDNLNHILQEKGISASDIFTVIDVLDKTYDMIDESHGVECPSCGEIQKIYYSDFGLIPEKVRCGYCDNDIKERQKTFVYYLFE